MANNIVIQPNRPASVVVTPQNPSTIVVGGKDGGSNTIKDVSLFIYSPYDEGYDHVYVKAPAGMIKETDKVIFARYISGRTRNKIGGNGTVNGERNKYRGWIRPKYTVEGKPAGYIYMTMTTLC